MSPPPRARRILARLRPDDLRWRLTLWVAAVLITCAAVVYPVVLISTGSQIRDRIDRDVAAQANGLARALTALDGLSVAEVTRVAGRDVRAQPYRSSSTLLFVLVPGVAVISNHPELFGSREAERGESLREQAAENRSGARLKVPRDGRFDANLVDAGRLRIIERTVTVGGRRITVGAGQPLAQVREVQESLTTAFLLAGAIVLLLACAVSYLVGSRVSAPLRRLAAVAQQVDGGDLAPRMHPPAGSSREIEVLAIAFNHMLDRLEQAFSVQREFVADASHELRTPLTVIRGQLEVLAAQEHPSTEEIRHTERMLLAEVGRVSRLVNDLLLLARTDQGDSLSAQEIDVAEYVRDLWAGMEATAARRFELSAVPDGTLEADPDRLAQAIRNLATNAIDHTEEPDGLIRLEVTRTAGGTLLFAIIDDGPGIPAGERERVFERFHRLDRARSRSHGGGSGLGLAIVRAIAEAHGGSVRAVAPRDGRGARFELRLPGFIPSAGSAPRESASAAAGLEA